ncbi:MAG: Vacuolar protein sorting-associated protein 53 [Chaenotheca gracillima]|nr:MAG: Vacuolar protein sorting-associated protein 53 [Chaenotheca gracillima]
MPSRGMKGQGRWHCICLTHTPQFGSVKANHKQLSDLWADVQIPVDGQCGCLLALVSFKQQYPHLKIILSIGGGGPGSQNMSIVAASRTARQNFAVSALDLVTNYGLDGIDIDWEHPSTPQEGLNYVQLLRTARQHMPSPAFFISSALPAGTWALRNIDLSQAQKYLDRVNLMCYDFSGPWTNQCGHHSQLFPPAPPYEPDAALCGHSAMEYVMSEGIPAEKLLMGIPVFGRSFIGARSLGDSYIGHGGNDGVYDYKDLPLPGTAEAFDATAGAAMCIGDDSGFVTYDNPESVRLKATYVRQRAMGGLFYWTATADGVGSRSLIEAGFSGLHQ